MSIALFDMLAILINDIMIYRLLNIARSSTVCLSNSDHLFIDFIRMV